MWPTARARGLGVSEGWHLARAPCPTNVDEREEDSVSGVVDVGEAMELTFSGPTGSEVTATWLDPNQLTVVDMAAVAETPAGSGKFPMTFTPTSAGVWTALFRTSGQSESYFVRAQPVIGPPPFAVIGDVGKQFGPMTPAQEGLTGHLVRAASALLRGRAPALDEDIRSGRVDRENAATTVTNMVLRVLRNPQGLRAETTGPFSRTYDTSAAAGQLVVTDYDLAAIERGPAPMPDGLAALGVGTIRVQPGLAPPAHPLGGHVRRLDRSGRPPGWTGWPYGGY